MDLDRECLTDARDARTVTVRGGVLADWAGSGKTVTVLSLCVASPADPVSSFPVVPSHARGCGQFFFYARLPRTTSCATTTLLTASGFGCVCSECHDPNTILSTLEFPAPEVRVHRTGA